MLHCDYIIQDAHKKLPKKHTPPKAAAIRLTLLLFPMCTKPRARYQNSEPPNHRNRSRFGSRLNCTHLKEISPPQYHIYIDNTFRACGKDSPDKKPRARLTDITIRVNQILIFTLEITFNELRTCPECKNRYAKHTCIKALSHGAIVLATCNAILVLIDVKLGNTRFHHSLLIHS